jgi:hypothetical protein
MPITKGKITKALLQVLLVKNTASLQKDIMKSREPKSYTRITVNFDINSRFTTFMLRMYVTNEELINPHATRCDTL